MGLRAPRGRDTDLAALPLARLCAQQKACKGSQLWTYKATAKGLVWTIPVEPFKCDEAMEMLC